MKKTDNVSKERNKIIIIIKKIKKRRRRKKGNLFLYAQPSMTVISGPKRKIDEKEEKCTENEYQSFKDICQTTVDLKAGTFITYRLSEQGILMFASVGNKDGGGGGGGWGDRDRETDRQTDIQTDRYTDRQRHRKRWGGGGGERNRRKSKFMAPSLTKCPPFLVLIKSATIKNLSCKGKLLQVV